MAKIVNTVAIDIGSKNIKIVKGTVGKTGLVTISEVITGETPEECIENGYIRKLSDLNLFLKGLIGKSDLGKLRCYVNVRSSDIVAREIAVPVIKGSKLTKLIKNEVLTVFGNASEYYTDYAITGEETVDYKNVYNVMAYAMPKEIVVNTFDVFSGVDIVPSHLDVHRNSLRKLVKDSSTLINQEPINEKCMILVDIGASYLDIDLVIDCKSIFKRSIPISEDLHLADEFNEGYESYNSLDSYNSGGYEGYLSNDNLDDYLYGNNNITQVSPIFTKISEELYKMTQFALSRKKVDNVYLYGGNSRIEGLAEYLKGTLGVNVERIFNVSNIEVNAEGVDVADIMIAASTLIRM